MSETVPDIQPMRPVEPSQVRDSGRAWYQRGWFLVVAAYAIDGLVWWWSGTDVMYGLIVAITVMGASMESKRIAGAWHRIAMVALATAAVVIAGTVMSAQFSIGLPVSSRLALGAGGIVVGALAARVLLNREARR